MPHRMAGIGDVTYMIAGAGGWALSRSILWAQPSTATGAPGSVTDMVGSGGLALVAISAVRYLAGMYFENARDARAERQKVREAEQAEKERAAREALARLEHDERLARAEAFEAESRQKIAASEAEIARVHAAWKAAMSDAQGQIEVARAEADRKAERAKAEALELDKEKRHKLREDFDAALKKTQAESEAAMRQVRVELERERDRRLRLEGQLGIIDSNHADAINTNAAAITKVALATNPPVQVETPYVMPVSGDDFPAYVPPIDPPSTS